MLRPKSSDTSIAAVAERKALCTFKVNNGPMVPQCGWQKNTRKLNFVAEEINKGADFGRQVFTIGIQHIHFCYIDIGVTHRVRL